MSTWGAGGRKPFKVWTVVPIKMLTAIKSLYSDIDDY